MDHFHPLVPIILVKIRKDCHNRGYEDGKVEFATPDIGEQMKRMNSAYKYIECSSLKGEGVREVFGMGRSSGYLSS